MVSMQKIFFEKLEILTVHCITWQYLSACIKTTCRILLVVSLWWQVKIEGAVIPCTIFFCQPNFWLAWPRDLGHNKPLLRKLHKSGSKDDVAT